MVSGGPFPGDGMSESSKLHKIQSGQHIQKIVLESLSISANLPLELPDFHVIQLGQIGIEKHPLAANHMNQTSDPRDFHLRYTKRPPI